LERSLGAKLFQRHARGVDLTAEGRALADAATGALSDIDAVTASLRSLGRNVDRLRLATFHSFSYCWLLPRVRSFTDANPRVRLSVETGLALARFDNAGPDLAIRYGAGYWTGLTSHLLMEEELFPAAAPTLPALRALSDVASLIKRPLITDLALQGWREWLRAAGIRGVRLPEMHSFTDSTDAMRAAAAGLGVALVRSRIAAPYLQSGELVRLPGPALKARFRYYAVHPSHQRLSSCASAFIDWVRREATLDITIAGEPRARDSSPKKLLR
jgi:DNA-binding transcriptional LysR family regulator